MRNNLFLKFLFLILSVLSPVAQSFSNNPESWCSVHFFEQAGVQLRLAFEQGCGQMIKSSFEKKPFLTVGSFICGGLVVARSGYLLNQWYAWYPDTLKKWNRYVRWILKEAEPFQAGIVVGLGEKNEIVLSNDAEQKVDAYIKKLRKNRIKSPYAYLETVRQIKTLIMQIDYLARTARRKHFLNHASVQQTLHQLARVKVILLVRVAVIMATQKYKNQCKKKVSDEDALKQVEIGQRLLVNFVPTHCTCNLQKML